MSTPEKFKAAMARLEKDPQRVQISIEKINLWVLLSVIQLASRHPHAAKSPAIQSAVVFAREAYAALTANDPDLAMLAAMGWEKTYDEVTK